MKSGASPVVGVDIVDRILGRTERRMLQEAMSFQRSQKDLLLYPAQARLEVFRHDHRPPICGHSLRRTCPSS
jgi:hypothetical protein